MHCVLTLPANGTVTVADQESDPVADTIPSWMVDVPRSGELIVPVKLVLPSSTSNFVTLLNKLHAHGLHPGEVRVEALQVNGLQAEQKR